MNPGTTMLFIAEGKTVFRLIRAEGETYPFATPRFRKNPDDPVITVCANQCPGHGKPDYFIKNGRGENLSGIFIREDNRYGFGNHERRDTLLIDWQRDAGTLTIHVLKNGSQNATQDRANFIEWRESANG